MGLFGSLIRTAVNVATLPLAVAADVVEVVDNIVCGNSLNAGVDHTADNLKRIKDEAE